VANATAQIALLPTYPKRGFTMATNTNTATKAPATKAPAKAPQAKAVTPAMQGAALLLAAPNVTTLCGMPQQPPLVVLAAAMALPPMGVKYLPNMASKAGANFGQSLRGYTYATAILLGKAMPGGFTQNQFRYALCGCILPAGHPLQQFSHWGANKVPTSGWPPHNAHQWACKPTVQWCLPA